MEEFLGGGKSGPGFNKFVFAQNDTSNYVRNVVMDASGSFFISSTTGNATRPALSAPQANLTVVESRQVADGTRMTRRASDYWLTSLGPLGSASLEGDPTGLKADSQQQPLAGTGYKFYRDVTAYGAKGDGVHDDTEAINAAVQDGKRCGLECGNTFKQGAIIYFPVRPSPSKVCPPRRSLITEPVYSLGHTRSAARLSSTFCCPCGFIHLLWTLTDRSLRARLYYTQFIGHPTNRPTILGCGTFSGIALMDTDPYIPGGQVQRHKLSSS